MTERKVSGEHPSTEVMSNIPSDVTLTTDASTSASLSPLVFSYFFYIPGIIVGVLGAAANGIIVYALYASKQHKKQMLIFNQNIIDLFTCFWLFVTYIVHLSDPYLVGALGYWVCMLIITETILYIGIMASKVNLMAITIERYLKVVHSTWSKKKLRNWMRYAAMAVAWIGGAAYSFALWFTTGEVLEGQRLCRVLLIWQSPAAYMAYGIYDFLSFYAIPLLIFAFCYGRILVAIRRQARVMASHDGPRANTTDHKIQTNVVKTMILVTLLFAFSNSLFQIYVLLVSVGVYVSDTVYYTAMFLSFVYICANPFVYAIKFKPVKEVLIGLMRCKVFHQSVENSHANAIAR